MSCNSCPYSEDIASRKAALRKEIRAKRRSLGDEEVCAASKAAAEKFMELDAVKKARLILSYMPAKNELDVRRINTALTALGKQVAYPLCVENGGLRLYVPETADALRPGSYGILEPDPAMSSEVFPADLDLIIVPAVAFTSDCMRLGQGGGYYDRLLEKTSAVTVGIGYDFQLLPELPIEEHDKALDIIVTPSAVFTRRNDVQN